MPVKKKEIVRCEAGAGKVDAAQIAKRPGRRGEVERQASRARSKLANDAKRRQENAKARQENAKALAQEQKTHEAMVARVLLICAQFCAQWSHTVCNCQHGNKCHGGVFHHGKFDPTRKPRCQKQHGVCPENAAGFRCTRKVCLCLHPPEVGGFKQELLPLRTVEWCTDTCTVKDCPKRHPDFRNVCKHEKWNPMSGKEPKPHQLCAHHCSAAGCHHLHWCRIQMAKGFCDEPNCRMDHWETKCVPVPAMDQFPPIKAGMH